MISLHTSIQINLRIKRRKSASWDYDFPILHKKLRLLISAYKNPPRRYFLNSKLRIFFPKNDVCFDDINETKYSNSCINAKNAKFEHNIIYCL